MARICALVPLSAARRSNAASESGLGSTTVTRWPSSASGTANPPVPPPASSTESVELAGPTAPEERVDSASRRTSQTTAVRTAVRGRAPAMPASVERPASVAEPDALNELDALENHLERATVVSMVGVGHPQLQRRGRREGQDALVGV